MTKKLAVAALMLTSALSAAPVLGAGATGTQTVEVTYENLTTGRPFSPSVVFSHDSGAAPLFKEGEAASFGIMRLAEEGNPGPAAGMAVQQISGKVGSVAIGLPIGPGGTRTVEVTVDKAHPLISAAWMLGQTNDGFTGFNAVDVSKGPQTIEVYAWDAGTEKNNEKKPYLIALMGTDRDPENGVIARHTGIRGDADAPADWKFDPSKPVARSTVGPSTM
jgi:hypothetical protein